MKFLDSHLDNLSDAIHTIDSAGKFFLDDACWSADGYISVSLAYCDDEAGCVKTLRVFDLRSSEWTPALLLLACLRLIFPERDCVALVKLRNKLFNKYFK